MQSYRFESVLAHPSFDLWNPIGQVESRKRHVQRNQARFPQNHGFLYSIFSTWSTARQYTPIACISLFSDCQSTLITENNMKKKQRTKKTDFVSCWKPLKLTCTTLLCGTCATKGRRIFIQTKRKECFLFVDFLVIGQENWAINTIRINE